MSVPITLVTGARKGIGRFLVERYLALGHTVFGCSRTSSDLAHPHYRHFDLDVGDESAVVAMCAEIRKSCGRLDNVVNNAGVASMNHAALTPGSTAERLLRTNVLGTFVVCREAFKIMQKQRYGRIVNFTTVAVPMHLEGEAIYAASKAAVESLTQVLAREFAEFGVTVNAVGPTPADTDLIRGVPAPKIDAIVQRQAIKRRGSLEDVANAVDIFLKPESSFITAQVVYLGGV